MCHPNCVCLWAVSKQFAEGLTSGSTLRHSGYRMQRPVEFDQAVEAEVPMLRRMAQRLARTSEDAEDLVQSTVMHALRSYPRFDGVHLRSWLVTIMRNRQRSLWRRLRIVKEVGDVPEDLSTGPQYWAAVENRMELQEVLAALERVSEPLRVALILCDVEEMSYEEAAVAMDVPIGTVRSRLFRARKQLRDMLVAKEAGP